MTQRIFDVENKKDMADLWDLLPENAIKIKKSTNSRFFDRLYRNGGDILAVCVLNINWHNKTEIIKPVKEATEADIGKLCIFWDSEDGIRTYGILQSIGSTAYRLQNTDPYSECYHHCRRLTKQEIEELI